MRKKDKGGETMNAEIREPGRTSGGGVRRGRNQDPKKVKSGYRMKVEDLVNE